MPYLSFAVICLLFGSNFILMSRATEAMGPVTVGAGRVLGAALVLAAAWRLVSPEGRVPRGKLLACLGVGLLANGYPYAAQPYLIATARQLGDVGHGFFGMMVAFTPLLTILASVPMLGIKPTARQLAGVVGGLGFMALVLFDGNQRGVPLWMLGMAFSIPLSYAVANTYLRRALNDVPALPLTTSLLIGPALLLFPLATAESTVDPLGTAGVTDPSRWPVALAALAALGVTGTGATMWLFVRLVQTEGPLFAGMVTYIVPLVAIAWGAVDGETISPWQIVGIAGVLAMVALVQAGAARRAPGPEPQASSDVATTPNEV